MNRHSNKNNSRRVGGRRAGRGWFCSAAGDGENKHASLRHRSLVSPRSSRRNNALLALLLISSSMLANYRYVKDASRYLDAHANNVKKLSHLPHKPARTAAICAVQKWGLPYIDEWVDYHLAIGFETIFIYDNSDDFETQGWYSNRFQNGTDRVEIFHWPGVAQQMPAYDECIRHIKHSSDQDHFWISFIDLDEFVVIKDTEKFPFITDFLETVPQDAGGFTMNWQVFGWNNQTKYEAKPLSLRFNLFRKNKHVKTIARTDRVSSMPNPHFAQYNDTEKIYKSVDTDGETVEGPFNNRMPTDVLAINHYYAKSLEEYTARCERGRADLNVSKSLLKGKDTYHPCLPEEVILAEWRSHSNEHFEFDDNVWKLLKERVPSYTKYENR